MIDFPLLKNDEVAVIMTDQESGHVLLMNGELYTEDSTGSPFIKFSMLAMAEAFVKDFAAAKKGIEFIIFDKDQTAILTILSGS